MATLFIFNRPIDQVAETIRRALPWALVPYYPIADRLVISTTQHSPTIACTDEGVVGGGYLE
jgi:hypothetical protein